MSTIATSHNFIVPITAPFGSINIYMDDSAFENIYSNTSCQEIKLQKDF